MSGWVCITAWTKAVHSPDVIPPYRLPLQRKLFQSESIFFNVLQCVAETDHLIPVTRMMHQHQTVQD